MEAKIIDLVKIIDPRGNLTVAEGCKDVPFDVKRVYWVYDVPAGESRGGHAHKQCREVIIAVSVDTDTWRTLDDFSSGAVCLVLASEPFDEEDYIRDYHSFMEYIKNKPDV